MVAHVNRTLKIVIGATLLVVACVFGFLAFIAFSANLNPTMGHVFTLMYVFGIVSAAFLISGILLMVSSAKLTQPKK